MDSQVVGCQLRHPQVETSVRSRTLDVVASPSLPEEVSAVSVPTATGLTYDDLAGISQDDHLRRELIDGELYVSPSPMLRHQDVVVAIVTALQVYAREHGGRVLTAPSDVLFASDTVIQPDVLYLASDRASRLTEERFVDVVPDLIVEVSSPATRRLDLIKKRNLYEREGVHEYWFIDLEADQVDLHRLDDSGHYGQPQSLGAGEELTCFAAPGFTMSADEALAR
jgi:Uma2 family endonuclease